MNRLSPGRHLNYFPGEGDDALGAGEGEHLMSIIAKVNGDGTVNLSVLGADGNWIGRSGVYVHNPADEQPAVGVRYCAWPVYGGAHGETKRRETTIGGEKPETNGDAQSEKSEAAGTDPQAESKSDAQSETAQAGASSSAT